MHINCIQDHKNKLLCQHSQLTLAPIYKGEYFFVYRKAELKTWSLQSEDKIFKIAI